MSSQAIVDPALLPGGIEARYLLHQEPETSQNHASLRDLFSDDEGGQSEEEQMGTSHNQMSAIQHELRGSAPFGGRKSKRTKGRKQIAPDTMPTFEVAGLLGQANRFYAESDLEAALAVIKEIIRIEHNTFDAWILLAEINQARGNLQNQRTALSVAATLRPRNAKLWLDLIGLSKDQDVPFEEIDEYYGKVAKAEPKDLDILQERAQFCAEHGRYKKAIDHYKQALSRIPHEIVMVQDLAMILRHEERFDEAVSVLEAASKHYMQEDERVLFDLPQLHMLSEAYVFASSEKPASMLQDWIRHLKRIARWIHGREEQTFWDHRQDDAEFDTDSDRRSTEPLHDVTLQESDVKLYSLPPEIHVRLGQLRLATGKDGREEAKRHFTFLDFERLDLYWDLVVETARSLLEHEEYEASIEYFQVLVDNDFADLPTTFAYAKALKALGEYEQAQEMLEFVIEQEPEDTDAMVLLARVHELLGDRQKALDLINTVIEVRRVEEEQWREQRAAQQLTDDADTYPHASQVEREQHGLESRWQKRIPVSARSGVKRKRVAVAGGRSSAAKHEDLVAYETRKLEETAQCIKKLELTETAMLADQPDAVDQWMKAASNLVDDFRTVGHFFPSKKKMPETALAEQIVRGRGRQRAIQTAEERLLGMANRLQEGLQVSRGGVSGADKATHFRQVSFARWLEIWMQYALLLVINDAAEEAWALMAIAEMAQPFSSDPVLSQQIRKFLLFLACKQGDTERASMEARRWILQTGLQLDPIRMSMTACYGMDGQDVFRQSSSQKFFLRLIKTMDKALGREVGQGFNKQLEYAPKKDVAHVLTLYGEKLSAGRQYILAIHYFMRAAGVAQEDPRVILDLGIAFLHRAMQRQVDNRNVSVVEAFSFLHKYYRIRKESGDLASLQEAEYNLGRAYHTVSLYHLAIARYRRVLAMSDAGFEGQEMSDFVCDAAYNLVLIMVMSGHAPQAAALTEQYLSM